MRCMCQTCKRRMVLASITGAFMMPGVALWSTLLYGTTPRVIFLGTLMVCTGLLLMAITSIYAVVTFNKCSSKTE